MNDETITTIVEELFFLFKNKAELMSEAAMCDSDYKDEAREIMSASLARAAKN